jgi:hypothetical protein
VRATRIVGGVLADQHHAPRLRMQGGFETRPYLIMIVRTITVRVGSMACAVAIGTFRR